LVFKEQFSNVVLQEMAAVLPEVFSAATGDQFLTRTTFYASFIIVRIRIIDSYLQLVTEQTQR